MLITFPSVYDARMIIYPPEVRSVNEKVRVTARFTCAGVDDHLWFEVDKKYADSIVTEKIDAFLLALLPLAMKRGEDVYLKHPVSQRVYYNASRHLPSLINTAWPEMKKVSVFQSGFAEEGLVTRGKAVGTGLSCGIDSLCTIAENTSPEVPASYRITHCVFTNVGSHGSMEEENAPERYQGRLKNALGCANELGLEVIIIDSNLAQVLSMDYDRSHTIRNASAVMLLEKLFSRYYYSSGVAFRDVKVQGWDMSDYDLLTLSYLSTDALDFVSAGSQHRRTEKTAIVAEFPPSYRWLNVCAHEVVNCSHCEKCLRTLFTLELLGKIDRYAGVFDLERYRKERRRYMGSVWATRKTGIMNREIAHLIAEVDFHPGASFYLYYPGYRVTTGVQKIMKSSLSIVVNHFDAQPRAKNSKLLAPARAALKVVRRTGSRRN
jgi:hypothetical protein